MIENPDGYKKARSKTKVITLPDSDEQVTIVNLTAGGWCELINVQKTDPDNNILRASVIAKYSTPMFDDLSVEEVMEVLYLDDLMFLSSEIMDLSGSQVESDDPEKKLSSVQS